MLPKEALGEVPGGRQLPGLAHQGMHPRDAGRDVRVFDAVAGLGIIFHDFAGTAAAFDVELEEDGGTVAGDADAVVFDQGLDGAGVEEGAKEGDEVGVAVGADGAVDIGDGDGAEGFGLRCLGRSGKTWRDRLTTAGVRMVGEVLLRGVVVAAGRGVVAAADSVGELRAGFVDVEREAVRLVTTGTGMAGGRPVVGL